MRPPRDSRAETTRSAAGSPVPAVLPMRSRARAWPVDWRWETDAALCYAALSVGFADAAGVEPRRLIGTRLIEAAADGNEPVDPGRAEARDALASSLPFRELLHMAVADDGGERFWLLGGTPMLDRHGTFEGYRGTGCDVTAIVGPQRAASRAKSSFLASMSHELRTPLNAILGFSEILGDAVLGRAESGRAREYAGYIHESATHLLTIVNDILDLAKIEAGKVELREEPVDVGDVIRTVCRLMQKRAADSELRLEARIADRLPRLLADERAIMQILTNLVSNALKFTPPRGDVRIEAELVEGEGEAAQAGVLIGVHDTGIGIAERDIATVLAPFGQVAPALRARDLGTGLGLPLTRGLVALHQGTLQIRSVPGVGTSVLVHLPAARLVAAAGASG